MIEEAPLPACVGGQVSSNVNPATLTLREDDVAQTLVDSVVADANAKPNRRGRPLRGRRIESRRGAPNATARQRQRDRETTGDWNNQRRTGHATYLSIGDLKTDRRTLLGGVEFAQEVDSLDWSVLDVPASRA